MNPMGGQRGEIGHEVCSAVPADAAPAVDSALLVTLTAAADLRATLVFLRRALRRAGPGGVRLQLSGDGLRCLAWPGAWTALEQLRAQGLRVELRTHAEVQA